MAQTVLNVVLLNDFDHSVGKSLRQGLKDSVDIGFVKKLNVFDIRFDTSRAKKVHSSFIENYVNECLN